MFENIFTLEKSLGDAENADPFLRKWILDAKLTFYETYSDAAVRSSEKL